MDETLEGLILTGRKLLSEEEAQRQAVIDQQDRRERENRQRCIELIADALPEALHPHLIWRHWLFTNRYDGSRGRIIGAELLLNFSSLDDLDLAPIILACDVAFDTDDLRVQIVTGCTLSSRNKTPYQVGQYEAEFSAWDNAWEPRLSVWERFADLPRALASASAVGDNLDVIIGVCRDKDLATPESVPQPTAGEKLYDLLRQIVRQAVCDEMDARSAPPF